MADAYDTPSRPAGKPAAIPCTVLSGDTLNAVLAVDSEGARIALDLDVRGKRCIHLILDPNTALDLALRITGAVMRQRRAAKPEFTSLGRPFAGRPARFNSGGRGYRRLGMTAPKIVRPEGGDPADHSTPTRRPLRAGVDP